MARGIKIADQMELDNILDSFPEGKRAECVSYLVSLYGLDNYDEYFDIEDFVEDFEREPEYTMDDIYSDYSLQDLYSTRDCYFAYGDDLLEEFTSRRIIGRIADEDLLDELNDRVKLEDDKDTILGLIENFKCIIKDLRKKVK